MANLCEKFFKTIGEDPVFEEDPWTKNIAFKGIDGAYLKKWLANIVPSELLKRSMKDTLNSILTLCECDTFYTKFPDQIDSPNYGDNWGRSANYIEINDRAIAKMEGDRCSAGIISAIKLLPAIPPSAKSWANCIILSQIFPNIYGDGYNKPTNEENSLYGIRLSGWYSDNIIDYSIAYRFFPEDQIKLFNDLAHFRGIKTGFRIIIAEDQIKIAFPYQDEENFRWSNPAHQEIFINECAKLFKLGFDAMFVDSAKHIGNYNLEDYKGRGKLPEYTQMQYILEEIRARSGKTSLSFAGEKSTNDERYKNMGLTTGTSYYHIDNEDKLRELSEKAKYSRNYAPGDEISNDNDIGGTPFEERIQRIRTALFGYKLASDKLASFMQMEDIFPLRYDTNTHQLMMSNPSYSTDGTPESHWENLFTKDDGRNYNKQVGKLFAYALNF